MIDPRSRVRCQGCRRRVIDGVGLILCERCYAGSGYVLGGELDWRVRSRYQSLTFEQQVYRAMLIRRYVRVLEKRLEIRLAGPGYMAASDYVLRELERSMPPLPATREAVSQESRDPAEFETETVETSMDVVMWHDASM